MNYQNFSQAFTALQQAMDMIERGEYAGADAQFDRAESLAPHFPGINLMRAQAMNRAGRVLDAVRHFGAAAIKAQIMGFQAHQQLAASLEQSARDAAFQSYRDLLAPRYAPAEIEARARKFIEEYTREFTNHANTLLDTAANWVLLHAPLLMERGFSFRGARVLEIGGSIVPAVCYLYAAMGARVCAVDKFRTAESINILGPSAQRICHETIFTRLAKRDLLPPEWLDGNPPLIMDEIVAFSSNSVTFDPRFLDFRGGVDAANLPFDSGSFDLVSSVATLEHVGDPDGDPADTVREIARVLKPGGWSAHMIDLCDHRDPKNAPLDFLQYSDAQWRAMSVPQNQRANRWRMSRWREAFKNAGLEEVVARPETAGNSIPVTPETVAQLHADFKNLDFADLSAPGCLILSRKPL
jgi:SAM-dependent methyltransferase